jgi:hypothetical protein
LAGDRDVSGPGGYGLTMTLVSKVTPAIRAIARPGSEGVPCLFRYPKLDG